MGRRTKNGGIGRQVVNGGAIYCGVVGMSMLGLMMVGQWRIGFASLWLANVLVLPLLALGFVTPVARIRSIRGSFGGGRVPPGERAKIGWIVTVHVCLVAFVICGLASIDSGLWIRGTGDLEHARIEVAANGTEVMVSGTVEAGFTERLREILDANPRVTTLQLQGPGGLVIEARKAIALVRERGLSTFVRSRCVSACAEIFLAGARRSVLSEAGREDVKGQVGFHRSGLSIGGVPSISGGFWNTADFGSAGPTCVSGSRPCRSRPCGCPPSARWWPTVS